MHRSPRFNISSQWLWSGTSPIFGLLALAGRDNNNSASVCVCNLLWTRACRRRHAKKYLCTLAANARSLFSYTLCSRKTWIRSRRPLFTSRRFYIGRLASHNTSTSKQWQAAALLCIYSFPTHLAYSGFICLKSMPIIKHQGHNKGRQVSLACANWLIWGRWAHIVGRVKVVCIMGSTWWLTCELWEVNKSHHTANIIFLPLCAWTWILTMQMPHPRATVDLFIMLIYASNCMENKGCVLYHGTINHIYTLLNICLRLTLTSHYRRQRYLQCICILGGACLRAFVFSALISASIHFK